jgi:hypothetical protein
MSVAALLRAQHVGDRTLVRRAKLRHPLRAFFLHRLLALPFLDQVAGGDRIILEDLQLRGHVADFVGPALRRKPDIEASGGELGHRLGYPCDRADDPIGKNETEEKADQQAGGNHCADEDQRLLDHLPGTRLGSFIVLLDKGPYLFEQAHIARFDACYGGLQRCDFALDLQVIAIGGKQAVASGQPAVQLRQGCLESFDIAFSFRALQAGGDTLNDLIRIVEGQVCPALHRRQ